MDWTMYALLTGGKVVLAMKEYAIKQVHAGYLLPV